MTENGVFYKIFTTENNNFCINPTLLERVFKNNLDEFDFSLVKKNLEHEKNCVITSTMNQTISFENMNSTEMGHKTYSFLNQTVLDNKGNSSLEEQVSNIFYRCVYMEVGKSSSYIKPLEQDSNKIRYVCSLLFIVPYKNNITSIIPVNLQLTLLSKNVKQSSSTNIFSGDIHFNMVTMTYLT
uniref:Helper protein P20 n=1 Tax=Bacillus thuringiensis subsp. kurstaki TaxID=29339 RepID=Q83ZN9_BACTK|nr:helper protein P20 [Bacillus thuringiensis serovar kurstaki str. HD-1]